MNAEAKVTCFIVAALSLIPIVGIIYGAITPEDESSIKAAQIIAEAIQQPVKCEGGINE